MESVTIAILAVAVIALAIALTTMLLNMPISQKIRYYETPRGILDRIFNESLDREYWVLKNTSSILNVIGSASLIIAISGFAVFTKEYKQEDLEGEELI